MNRDLYFNSIKVQLERGLAVGCDGGMLFQFHKGTIRTRIWLSLKSNPSISIP